MSIGSIVRDSFNGRILSHKVLGYRHTLLTDRHFRIPGDHLHGRLARLRDHRWHRHFRHLAITDFAGAIACGDCEFDVPEDVYGDFIAAAGEPGTDDEAAAASEAPEASLAGALPVERYRERIAQAHGWDKAAAILEFAAEEDRRQAAEAHVKGNGRKAGPAVYQADEQVDVPLDRGAVTNWPRRSEHDRNRYHAPNRS